MLSIVKTLKNKVSYNKRLQVIIAQLDKEIKVLKMNFWLNDNLYIFFNLNKTNLTTIDVQN